VEQQDELFSIAAREMLLLCAQAAVESPLELTIAVPKEVDTVRQTALSLRSCAEMAGSLLGLSGIVLEEPAGDAVATAPGPTGLLSGMLAKATSLAENAEKTMSAVVPEIAKVVTGPSVSRTQSESIPLEQRTQIAISHIADELDRAVAAFEESLKGAGREMVEKRKEAILNCYIGIIEKVQVNNPVNLVRGEAPHGPAQYKACKSEAASTFFMQQCRQTCVKGLVPILQEVVDDHSVQKTWAEMLVRWNEANTKLGEFEFSKGFQQEQIELNMPEYVVQAIVPEIGTLMGKEEAVIRTKPLGRSRRPGTFALCFSGDPPLNSRLPEAHYFNRTM